MSQSVSGQCRKRGRAGIRPPASQGGRPVAELGLSLAINGGERQRNGKLTAFQAPVPAVGNGKGHSDRSALSSVAIVGLGYVGLPTAAALHGECERIIGIDISDQRLAEIAALEADLS